MGDAEVIPLGTRGRPGRGTGTRPSSAARGLAPGGRSRRRADADDVDDATRDDATRGDVGDSPAPSDPPVGAPAADASEGVAEPVRTDDESRPAPALAEVPPIATDSGDESGQADAADQHDQEEDGERAPTRTTERNPIHGIPPADWLEALQSAAREVFGKQWEPQLARFLAFLRRRLTGDYEVDEYGFDREITERLLLTALRPLAQKWFRIDVLGVENVPAEGGALIVSNHSGTVPMDGLMTMVSVHDHTGRHLRPLGADLVFRLPGIAALARKSGATLACHEDAERMLRGGELVGVWPEGFKGIGKPFSERYKLQRFGRGGFVSAALRTGVPIVPLAVVGAEEIYPLVGNIPALARLVGAPYVPITPLFPLLGPLGLVPLPSKWLLQFGEPIRTDEYDDAAHDDPMLVFNVTDQVRETIQQSLYQLLMKRESVFG